MPLLIWDDCFNVGISEYDNEHKHLFSMLNKTYDAFVSGSIHKELEALLRELIDFSVSHFEIEERWMAANMYSGLLEHKREHQRFTTKICVLHKSMIDGNNVNVLELLQLLETWFVNHILVSDTEYVFSISDITH